jgi:hypothetical protein
MKPSVSYPCDHCGKRIAVTSKDPAVMTTKGIYHSNGCLQEAYVAAERAKTSVREAKRERRSQAAKERWAKRKQEVGTNP